MIRNLVLLGSLAALAAGCGGGGSDSAAPLPSLYRGSWSGVWSSPAINDGGAISFSVANDGSMTGTMAQSTASGSLSGVLDRRGHFDATAGFGASGNYVMSGSATLNNGHLVGSFSYVWLGRTYQGSFDAAAGTASSSN